MDTYLLLRSNKQSGPYSLQQLVTAGLKPYDLVWVEGKSAAWRYPSEVDALKEYAVATEEQPGLYKKPEKKDASQPVEKPAVEQTFPVEHKPLTSPKKIFVSMPENHTPNKTIQSQPVREAKITEQRPVLMKEKKEESQPMVVNQEPVTKEEPTQQRKQPALAIEEPELNEKYSESLEDIKRRYTETYLSRKKKSKWTSTHKSVAQVLGGAVFFCLIVVVLYRNFAGDERSPLTRTTVIQPDRRSVNTSSVNNDPGTTPPVATEAKKQQVKKQDLKKNEIDPPAEKPYTNKKQQKNDELTKENEVATVETTTAKKAVMPNAADESGPGEVKPKTRPININRLVKLSANNYKQRAFGGILNLQLTIDNDSKFELDKVVVELRYLKPSEQPLKTEKIIFSSIAPNGSQTLKVPDFLRGVKVSYRVLEIESSQYERHTAGL